MSAKAGSSRAPNDQKRGQDAHDDLDVDAFLNSEASSLTRETEMNRVLASFKLNAYEVLDIPLTAVNDDPDVVSSKIKRAFRSKSLLLHPDKLKHVDGPKAFDMIKKAEAELNDKDKRKNLDELIIDARMLVLRGMDPPLKPDTPDTYYRLAELSPPLSERIRQQAKQMMIDEELRRRRLNKMTMIAEGSEAKKKEDDVNSRKRKVEDQKQWEDSRETRVAGWRNFQSGGAKKKKVVKKALG